MHVSDLLSNCKQSIRSLSLLVGRTVVNMCLTSNAPMLFFFQYLSVPVKISYLQTTVPSECRSVDKMLKLNLNRRCSPVKKERVVCIY